MLVKLHIQSYLLLSDITLDLEKGLSVITGDSGAGKSMLMQAINFISGKKIPALKTQQTEDICVSALLETSDWKRIKTILPSAILEKIKNHEHAAPCLERTLTHAGKTRISLNQVTITLKQLHDIMSPLVHNHDQHAHTQLSDPALLLHMLDRFGKLEKQAHHCGHLFQSWQQLCKEAHTLEAEISEFGDLDQLKCMLDDIQTLGIETLDYDALANEHKRLLHAQDFANLCQKAQHELTEDNQSLGNRLHALASDLDHQTQLFPEAKDIQKLLEESQTLIQEAGTLLRDAAHRDSDNASDMQRLAELDETMRNMHAFSRKYQIPLHDLAPKIAQAHKTLETVAQQQATLKTLHARIHSSQETYMNHAQSLHTQRLEAAPKLAERISALLKTLGLEQATLLLACQERLQVPKKSGITHLECLFSANAGHTPAPIARTASGGELARTMLCFEAAITPPYPFLMLLDEADVGVSGEDATKIARLMQSLGSEHALLCITHSAQVAAHGTRHFHLCKSRGEHTTQSTLITLNPDQKLNTLARMISGDNITPTALATARDLHQQATLT